MQVTTGLLQPFGWGLGYPDWVDPSAPAAGSNFVHTVGGQHYERLLGARCLITTDSNAANRFVSVDYINARNITYCRNAWAGVIVASTTNQAFEWNCARASGEHATNTPVLAPLFLTFLPPGFQIQITLDNIQVGDTITSIHLWLEKFPVGPRGYPSGMVTEAEAFAAAHGLPD